MRRFFMLIPEAVQLVLHAASQAESGATYVLEMGEQVKLVDLARDLIRLSGLVPEEDVKIAITGLASGEKLYEELVGEEEEARPSAVEKILCVRPKRRPDARLFTEIDALESAAAAGRHDIVIAAMKEFDRHVPEGGRLEAGCRRAASDTGCCPNRRPISGRAETVPTLPRRPGASVSRADAPRTIRKDFTPSGSSDATSAAGAGGWSRCASATHTGARRSHRT